MTESWTFVQLLLTETKNNLKISHFVVVSVHVAKIKLSVWNYSRPHDWSLLTCNLLIILPCYFEIEWESAFQFSTFGRNSFSPRPIKDINVENNIIMKIKAHCTDFKIGLEVNVCFVATEGKSILPACWPKTIPLQISPIKHFI